MLGDNFKSCLARLQLGGKAHSHVSIRHSRPALGMKRDEVERHWFSVGSALVVLAVVQKTLEECAGFWIRRPGACRPADSRTGQRGAHPRCSVVIKLEVQFLGSVPVS